MREFSAAGRQPRRMTNLGLPVPGFTVTTEAATDYEDGQLSDEVIEQIFEAPRSKKGGKKFGDPDNPFLVSSALRRRTCMPGMMDTILNLGKRCFGGGPCQRPATRASPTTEEGLSDVLHVVGRNPVREDTRRG